MVFVSSVLYNAVVKQKSLQYIRYVTFNREMRNDAILWVASSRKISMSV